MIRHSDVAMFLGEHKQTLDKNGMLTLPSEFLDQLHGELIVTRGFDNNLMLFEVDKWQLFAQRVLGRPISLAQSRNLRRRLFSGAAVITLESGNRIRLPSVLRSFADLEREVVISAMYDYLELWSPDAWEMIQRDINDGADAALWETPGV